MRNNLILSCAIIAAMATGGGCAHKSKSHNLRESPSVKSNSKDVNAKATDYHALAIKTKEAFSLYSEDRKNETSDTETTKKLDEVADNYANASDEDVTTTLKTTYQEAKNSISNQSIIGTSLIVVGSFLNIVAQAQLDKDIENNTKEAHLENFKQLENIVNNGVTDLETQKEVLKKLRESYEIKNAKFNQDGHLVIETKNMVAGKPPTTSKLEKIESQGLKLKVAHKDGGFTSEKIIASPPRPDQIKRQTAKQILAFGSAVLGSLILASDNSLELAENPTCKESPAVCKLMTRLNALCH